MHMIVLMMMMRLAHSPRSFITPPSVLGDIFGVPQFVFVLLQVINYWGLVAVVILFLLLLFLIITGCYDLGEFSEHLTF